MRSSELVIEVNEIRRKQTVSTRLFTQQKVVATANMSDAVKKASLIFVAVPSSSFREVVKQIVVFAPDDAMLIEIFERIMTRQFLS